MNTYETPSKGVFELWERLLETRTQSDTKLCEQAIFYSFFCLLYTKKNIRNIMNCIVPVQVFPGSLFKLFTRYDQVIGRE